MKTVNWRHFDFVLLGGCLALLGLGLTLIYSGSLASFGGDEPILGGPVSRQVAYAMLGITLMVVLARIDYRSWSVLSPMLYVAVLLGLLIVLVIGDSAFGSRRWISFAGVQLQPSEPGKLITIVLLARILSEDGGRYLSGRTFLLTLAVATVPALLVFVEPDLGTSVVFIAVWLGMVFVAGAQAKHLFLLVSAGIVALPFAMLGLLRGYQMERLRIFLDPSSDPLGTGFNINQAAISIGSGGWTGKGLFNGPQTQLDFLRTQSTDYIFSVLGEELGFVGAMLLFGLFIVVLSRGIRAASRSRDPFGRLVAIGIVVMIMTQVFINIGVNIRLFPVTGIPLPFISQGGSSLVSMFMAIGILQSIILRQRPSRFRAASSERLLLPGT
ncbi:MAG: rod shape-determining protein RodA [Dehalococcoidia bacterium]